MGKLCKYFTGTHWMAEMTPMIVNGVAKYKTTSAYATCLSFHSPEEFAEFPRPRVLNTHLPPEYMPKQILEKRCKIVWMLRNPKDRLISGQCKILLHLL